MMNNFELYNVLNNLHRGVYKFVTKDDNLDRALENLADSICDVLDILWRKHLTAEEIKQLLEETNAQRHAQSDCGEGTAKC